MNKEALRDLLQRNTNGGRLSLPLNDLQSPPVTEHFVPFLTDEPFLLEGVGAPQDEGGAFLLTGTCRKGPFQGMTLSARFIAGDPVGLVLTAQDLRSWALNRSFPRVQNSLAKELLFDDAKLEFASQSIVSGTSISQGLWFRGKLNLSGSLGLYLFLIGEREMRFSGQITAGPDGIPEMQLSTEDRDGASLEFFSLSPIRLRLVSRAAPSPRKDAKAKSKVYLELHSGIQFTSQGRPRSIPLTACIYNPDSSIRLDADLTQAIDAGLDEVKALLNSVSISALPFGDFRVENVIKLTQLTVFLNPSAPTKVSNVALSIRSAQSWTLLEDRSGHPLLALEEISVTVGLQPPFTASSLSAYLEGKVRIGDGLLILSMAASATGVALRGYLDNKSQLSLGDLVRHFVNKSDSHTPSLRIHELDIMVQPGSHYELNVSISDLWSITLDGGQTLSLDEVGLHLAYTTASKQTEAKLGCLLELGGTQFSLTASYSTTGGGWDVQGGLAEGQTIELGGFLADLEYRFGIELPEFLYGIRLDTLAINFNTSQKTFGCSIGGSIPVEGGQVKGVISLNLRQVTGTGGSKQYEFSLAGQATVSDLQFTLDFLHNSTSNYFWATYSQVRRKDLRSLIGGISTTVAQAIPEGLEIEIKSALFLYAESKFLFGLNIGAEINLGQLPVVGKSFPEHTVGIEDLRVLIASQQFNAAEVKKLNQLIPTAKLPDAAQSAGEQSGSQDATKIIALKQGLNVGATLKFGETTRSLALPAVSSDSPRTNGSTGTTPTTQTATAASNAKWFKIQKSLGPFSFERIGLEYRDARVRFLLDAALSGAGLTLSLDGLEVSSPLTSIAPKFDLQGLGMAFKRGDLEIGGALVKRATDAYDGALVLRYKRLAIEALGSYETIDDRPSIFLYALIDYPLGGPAFFFVEGGAVGFGYNRTFTMPSIENLADFPLIKQAMGPDKKATGTIEPRLTPTELAKQLRPYVKPTVGEYFIAVGVKFTSFKTIKGFVLLTILFGEHVEIDLLGKATLTSPAGVDSSKALMSATLLFLGRFLPKEGFLMVRAQLAPDARLFDPNCHLSGGFAWYCWFDGDHKGDFALTLGGYHKLFKVPDHYPQVPRLALNWQVNPNLSLKAEAYFALTPFALMAGGKLEANWQSGNLQAWFHAEIDFLMGWQPFFYSGHVYVALGVRYRFEFFGRHEISAELTAQLDLWGPPFSGRARVQWNLLAFEVEFGPKEQRLPDPLKWAKFRESFLPDARMFSVTAEAGKVAQAPGSAQAVDATNLGCFNQRNLCISVRSPLPVKEPERNDTRNDLLKKAVESPRTTFVKEPVLGIAPMNKKAGEWKKSLVTIAVFRTDANPREDMSRYFHATRIRNNVPASLWGEKMDPKTREKGEPELLLDAICGYELRLSSPVTEDAKPEAVPLTKPKRRRGKVNKSPAAGLINRRSSGNVAKDIAEDLLKGAVRDKRSAVLNDLLPQVQVDWTSATVASWRGKPSLVNF